MAQPTERDRETAMSVIGYGGLEDRYLTSGERELVNAIAAALADERDKARQPFLDLAATWEADSPDESWGYVAELRLAAGPDE